MPAPLGSPVFYAATDTGVPAVGYLVYSYTAGTSTPLATYPTSADASAGTNANANPVVLDANGQAQIWLTDALYKIILKTNLGVTVWTIDSVSGTAGSSGSATLSQWATFGANPTFISATQFSVSGDQTPTFVVGTRTKSSNTGGTTYSQITASSFAGGITTVTLYNTSGVLDSGLSSVSTGIITIANNALPILTNLGILGTATTAVSTVATAMTLSSASGDVLGEVATGAAGTFTAKYAGTYFFNGYCEVQSAAGTTGVAGVTQTVTLFKNGSSTQQFGRVSWPYADSLARIYPIPLAGVLVLAANDVITFRFTGTFAGTALTASPAVVNVLRLI